MHKLGINRAVSKPPLGQHFLFDEKILNKIVDAAEVSRRDVVLEIGAGTGSLTQKLLMRARKVIAVELDKRLAQPLREKFGAYRNIEIIQKNILQIPNSRFEIPFKVVGNIPYYISGKILRKFTENKNRPELLVLLLQKEVVERVCACLGKMSILAVAVQTFGKPEIVDYVPKEKFEPPPEVDSAILRIRMYKYSKLEKAFGDFDYKGRLETEDKEIEKIQEDFFCLVKVGFSAPRKQIHNNLQNGYHLSQKEVDDWLSRAKIQKKVRAQELGVGDWISLLENKIS